MSEELLITNFTGEPYQPARVYYQVSKKQTVERAFQKLKCMDYDAPRNRWVWLYLAEAKKLRFKKSSHKIPKEKKPFILGYFVFRSDQEMLLELRSFERVLAALRFFGKRINWRVAQPTRLRIVNKLFTTPKHIPPSFPQSWDEFFDREDVYLHNRIAEKQKLMELKNQTENPEEIRAAVLAWMEAKFGQPSPEIEEISLNIQDEGLDNLDFALKIRHIEAWERWRGNENFVMQDLMSQLFRTIPEADWQEEE